MDSPAMTRGSQDPGGLRLPRRAFRNSSTWHAAAARPAASRRRAPRRSVRNTSPQSMRLRPKDRSSIGGKSMGGRIASMIADDSPRRPHHGPALSRLSLPPDRKPEQLRTAHLAKMKTPALIVQGTRDSFGSPRGKSRPMHSPRPSRSSAGRWRPRSETPGRPYRASRRPIICERWGETVAAWAKRIVG